MTRVEIRKIEPSQIGTRIEFSDGFYTELSVERNINGSVTTREKTYIVGDIVEITTFNGKCVYNFK